MNATSSAFTGRARRWPVRLTRCEGRVILDESHFRRGHRPSFEVPFPMRLRVPTLLALLLVGTLTLADDAKKPGLQPGDDLPGPFRPYNVTGKYGERTAKDIDGKDKDIEGQFHCLVCERGLAPVAMVFARNVDLDKPPQELLDLLRKLSDTVQKNRKTRLGSFAVFVTDELPDAVTDDEKRFELSRKVKDNVDGPAKLNLGEDLALALESKKNLTHYPLEENAQVVVVLYKDLRVVQTFNFTKDMPLTSEAIDAVLAKVREMIGGGKSTKSP
jgi:hypothetical protein